jgi:hypothetical protein
MEVTEANLEDWMGELDPPLKDVSICYLAIPGKCGTVDFSVEQFLPLYLECDEDTEKTNSI